MGNTEFQLYLQENWTALMAAANNGRYAVVDLLLRHGADPDMQDKVSKPLSEYVNTCDSHMIVT